MFIKKRSIIRKLSLLAVLLLTGMNLIFAQTQKEKIELIKVCQNYIDGLYNGEASKLESCLSPELYKFGYWSEKGKFKGSRMTYQEALKFANDVLKSKKFAKPDAVQKIEILDCVGHIASAKITAWWGVDYVLLSKNSGSWIIEQILWQGPLKSIKAF